MKTESLVYLCTSDISGKLRGKGFPAAMIDGGASRAVGWTPTNVQITCFDTIADSPYGALGDLVLVPDPATRARVDFGDDGPVEDFMLGDVLHLDGRPWECCTRAILRQALAPDLANLYSRILHGPGPSVVPTNAVNRQLGTPSLASR